MIFGQQWFLTILFHSQVLLKTEGKIAKQLKDAEHLRLYTTNQGDVLRHMVSKYSKGLLKFAFRLQNIFYLMQIFGQDLNCLWR